MQYLFIINPVAGKRDFVELLMDKIHLLQSKYPIKVVVTQHAGHAREIIDSNVETFHGSQLYIFACGGDGTLNEVINGAWKYPNVSVGCIPYGSGNDFIKSFEHFKKSDFLNIENMINGSSLPVDLLFVNNIAGINMVTAGYDCAVAKEKDTFKKLPLVSGGLAYRLSVLHCLISKLHHQFTLVADGNVIHDISNDYLFAIAANGKYYGGGYKSAPKANLCDGYIDFVRVPTLPRLKFIQLVGSFKKGYHLDDPRISFIKCMRCKKLEIKSNKTIDVNVDGEIIPMKNPVITIKHNATRFILPAQTSKIIEPIKDFSFKDRQMAGAVISKTSKD
ncbi:MAG TPA: YegS/Rv2252/BmrU family lipid kinase [Clostridiales bacterium]|nr:YegS/Rv2252/BmrU family lipid kinase [Clostridiales bacterium]